MGVRETERQMGISTFSGAHPFRSECLLEAYTQDVLEENGGDIESACDEGLKQVPELLALIDAGRCPRCGAALSEGEVPCGSRITECRCVPVCKLCGDSEALESFVMTRISGPEDSVLLGLLGPVCDWPIDHDAEVTALAEARRRYGRRVELLIDLENQSVPLGDLT
jgi:hypothetical protein